MQAYACELIGADWGPRIEYAITVGKARYAYLLHLLDAGFEVSFKDIRVRSVNATPYDHGFVRNAKYRGVPEAKIGMRVEVEGMPGIIQRHNDSANWDVLFTDGPHRGMSLNCHPNWMMKYFREDGSMLYDFTKATAATQRQRKGEGDAIR